MEQPLTGDQARGLEDLIVQALTAKFAHGVALGGREELAAAHKADDDASAALWARFYGLVDPVTLAALVDDQARARRMGGA